MPQSKPLIQIALCHCMIAVAGVAGCSKESQPNVSSVSEKPTVAVVNYPLQYFAERIGGDLVDVRFLAPDGEDPAFWRPSDDAIGEMQSADLILLNGAGYAKWMESVSLPAAKTVDTSASFHGRLIQTQDTVIHSHGPQGDHSHTGTAFTTWLDFDQALQQASAVKDALITLIPTRAETITANFDSLEKDLTDLDESMKQAAEQIGDQPLLASHPVYQYLARRYRLNIKAVQWEPDVAVGDEDINELNKLLRDHRAKWMIWEGPPDPMSIDKLTTIEIGSVVFNPCGNRTPNPETDWLAVMRENIASFSDVIREISPIVSSESR